MNPYVFCDHMAALYNLLQDDLSRSVFWSRLQFDMDPSMSRAVQLLQYSDGYTQEELADLARWKEMFQKLHSEQKKIFLYGAGSFGRLAADLILKDGEDFFAFCDRQAAGRNKMPDIFGKPIYPPEYLFQNVEQCRVLITTTDYYAEIEQFLCQSGFPQEYILPLHFERYIDCTTEAHNKQYFSFPSLYQRGTSFVDAGCFDGETSVQFAKWCGGQYERILAFEPDAQNCKACERRVKEAGVFRFDLIQAGLSSQKGMVEFATGLNAISYIPDVQKHSDVLVDAARGVGNIETIQTDMLDAHTGHITVGFIKMDIEGSELSALQGGQNTIKRDKPFLARSVYHRRGDVLAIMDYLHQLVPEYRFWLRHYGPLADETVLYAAF